MKKRKNMESWAIRMYVTFVKKRLLNNLAWIAALGLLSINTPSMAAESTRYFLLLEKTADVPSLLSTFKEKGVRVLLRVPPTVVTATFPDSISPAEFQGIKTFYSGPVPLSVVETEGPLASAAGVQWNRSLVADPSAHGKTLSSVKSLVAKQTLPSPVLRKPRAGNGLIHLEWLAVHGAVAYEAEMASSPDFKKVLVRTITDKPDADLPILTAPEQKTTYLRVRSLDPVSSIDAEKHMHGSWSDTQEVLTSYSFSHHPTPPAPTSPANDVETDGLLAVLEWSPSEPVRVQIATKSDFIETRVDAIVSGGEYSVPAGALRVGETLLWRIQRWDSAISDWSEVRRFRVGAPRHVDDDMMINPEAPQ